VLVGNPASLSNKLSDQQERYVTVADAPASLHNIEIASRSGKFSGEVQGVNSE
jgi:hypothetical protein